MLPKSLLVSLLLPLLLQNCQNLTEAKRRPGLLQSTRLVTDIQAVRPCNVPDNAIDYLNVTRTMLTKVDSAVNAYFNITRGVPEIQQLTIRITKCREVVSSNTCELFQNWRFEKGACAAFTDPKAIWRSVSNMVKPRMECPTKPGMYSFANLTVGPSIVQAVPLPWEGNVWVVRLSMMETKTRYHFCTEAEVTAKRVRESQR